MNKFLVGISLLAITAAGCSGSSSSGQVNRTALDDMLSDYEAGQIEAENAHVASNDALNELDESELADFESDYDEFESMDDSSDGSDEWWWEFDTPEKWENLYLEIEAAEAAGEHHPLEDDFDWSYMDLSLMFADDYPGRDEEISEIGEKYHVYIHHTDPDEGFESGSDFDLEEDFEAWEEDSEDDDEEFASEWWEAYDTPEKWETLVYEIEDAKAAGEQHPLEDKFSWGIMGMALETSRNGHYTEAETDAAIFKLKSEVEKNSTSASE